MKRPHNPLTIAYLVLALALAGAFVRTEMIALQVEREACNAFHQSQSVLKDVLLLAIPTEVEITDDMTSKEIDEAQIERQRRIAFRDRLIRTIEEKTCE